MKKEFRAESKRLMDLMVNSIYTNREIFLRELISNASDAIDKIYYKALTDETLSFNKDDYFIRISADADSRTLTIEDTGIGMTEEELEENLGVIAKSGTNAFKENLEIHEDHDIIGQFGVGFYSAFMIASKVVVESKSVNSDIAFKWTSEGADGFNIEPSDKTTNGTAITLYLKADTEEDNYSEFLEDYRIKGIVRRYSNYIRYPIKMRVEKSRVVESAEETNTPDYETYLEDDILNSMIPVWRKNKKDLSDENYENFYHEKHYGFDEPLAHIHLSAEGAMSYKALLYIPSQAPYDYYTRDYEKGLELYSNGVMIMEKCGDLVPDYYSFVKGVVDSEDLSLNISREMLQQDRQLRAIERRLESKITEELVRMRDEDREKYEMFFKAFGNQLKVGTYDGFGRNADKLKDLLLFYSTNEKKLVTLAQYVEAMTDDQPYIYYASGESVERISKMPQVSIVEDKGYDILFFTEEIDEFAIKVLNQYGEKSFKSVSSNDLGFEEDETKDAVEDGEEAAQDLPMFERMKEILGEEVVRVKGTTHLKRDLVYLSTEGDISIEMEKTLHSMPNAGDVKAEKVLEINENHPVFAKLREFYEVDEVRFELYTTLLYDQARLIEGLAIEDPVAFAKKMSELM